jgi:cytochrome c556
MAQGDPHRDLLDRATAAIERMDQRAVLQAEAFDRHAEAFDRQAEAFDRQAEAFDRQERRLERVFSQMQEDRVAAQAREERMMRRFERSEQVFIEAISDIDANIQRNNERLEEMGAGLREIRDSIRAHTEAIFAVLDRLGPAPG